MSNHTIKAAREQSGKTQAQVAKEIGIAKAAYQRYECGKVIPNAIMGVKIAKALGTTSEKLWYTDL
ncbi:MAG: helix-turn-helix transcriptional regulator [Selenomonadaceae bacterium]|nr:helix-turn-helix transcriptional regulator [Selenomonadaceae bacterium]MBQ6006586.1 helix-turn-helix transcriptional regulator [Selenomonadaceae bacterium]MBR0290089.1 helix-turn-helix transcriptional regulator [Selenomonadaceae bacterium]